jgi:hypothetical protein
MNVDERTLRPAGDASMCALACPNCKQLWLTTARRGERFICRACRYAFEAGGESPFEAIRFGPATAGALARMASPNTAPD